MGDQYDLFGGGEDAKAEGIKAVASNNRLWIERGVRLADALLPHGNVMGEDIKRLPGLGKPTRPEAYGALVQACIRYRIIFKTGNFRKAKSTKNHAHRYEIYHRPGYPNPEPAPVPQVPLTNGPMGHRCSRCDEWGHFGINDVWYCRKHRDELLAARQPNRGNNNKDGVDR